MSGSTSGALPTATRHPRHGTCKAHACRLAKTLYSIAVVLLCRYILVYPQGCDVCNHLSLFLCVADYDKLLPGARSSCGQQASQEAEHSTSSSRAMQSSKQQRLLQGAQLQRRCVLGCVIATSLTQFVCVVACRLEPLCSVHDCSGQQGPQEEQVLG
jgi:hypothetical protein